VADIPERLTLRRNRDLVGRRNFIWVRRVLITLLVGFMIAALANTFGQRPSTAKATVPAATLAVYSPVRLRSGLYYEARFHIFARQEIKNAVLVLSSDWIEGITLNTIEPSPLGEASDNGRLSFTLGHIPARQSYLLYVQSQVNPTTLGRRDQNVWLYDDKTLLAKVSRTTTIFP
jgi:hypothetical protein